MLRQDLHFAKDDDVSISYIGEFVADENALLWFSVQKEHGIYYRAVECRLLKNGGYLLKNIYKPMIYAKDIVHIVWMAEDVFLIHDSNCRAIVYRDRSGDVISKIEISSNDIPYVFLNKAPDGGGRLDFLDTAGNIIQ